MITYNNNACQTDQSQVSFNAVQGVTYRIAVDGYNGAKGNIRLRLAPDKPVNDNFAAATSVPAQGGQLTGHNLGATKETGEPAPPWIVGGASVWWKWTAPATARATISTFGSDFDTILAVYTGSSLGSLQSVVYNDDSGTGNQSQVSFDAVAGTTYRIAVDGRFGITGEIKLQVAAAPPQNDNYENAILTSGGSGEFTGTNRGATHETGEPQHAGKQGYGSVWWKWLALANGTATINTSGSDFDTLLAVYTGYELDDLSLVVANDDANGSPQSEVQFTVMKGEWYSIAVDGKGDSNGNIKLNIVPPVPPNDNFANAITMSAYGHNERGTNFGASKEPGEPAHANKSGTASVWWKWTSSVSRMITIDTRGSNFNTVLAVYAGNSVDSLTEIVSNDDYAPPERYSRVQFRAVPFAIYRIAVDGAGAMEKGKIDLNLTLAPENDDFADAFTVPGAGGTVFSLYSAASRENGEPAHAGNSSGPTVWWKWTAQTSSRATINTYGSEFDTGLAVYTGNSVGSLTEVASQALFHNYEAKVQFNTVAGTTYRIVVFGNGYDEGRITLIVTPQPPSNDNFVDAIVIPPAGGQVIGTNEGATREAGEPPAHGVLCDSSVWWRWQSATDGPVTINTFDSEFDTTFAVYTGTALGNLYRIDHSNDIGEGTAGQVHFDADAGTTYWIAVGGVNNSVGQIGLNVITDIPANDKFENSTRVHPNGGRFLGTNVGATKEYAEPDHAGYDGVASVWWHWKPARSGPVSIDLADSDFDTTLAVYTGSAVGNLTEIASNDDSASGDKRSRVTFNASAGTIYRIAVDGYFYEQGVIVMEVTPPPPDNDNLYNAFTIAGSGGQISGNNRGATRESHEPLHAGRAGGVSVWWKWTAHASGTTFITTHGSEFDTLLAVYTGNTPGGLVEVASNDDWSSLQSQVQFQAVAGTIYKIAVDGYNGASGDIALKLYMGEAELVITSITPANDAWKIEVDGSAFEYNEVIIQQRTNLTHGAGWAPAPNQLFDYLGSGKYLITVPASDSPTIFYRALQLQ